MNTKRLLYLVTFLAVFAMASRVSMSSDTWWHLATGRAILEQHSIPQVDEFSYTRAGEPWLGPSVGWLMQLTLYGIYSGLGFGGLNLWAALMVTLTFIMLYNSLEGGPFLRSFIVIFAVTVSAVYWSARPYLMTFLLTAVTLKALEDFRWGRKRSLWALPFVMLLWVNSHGGWAVGLLLWGLYGLGEGLKWLGKARQPGQLIPTAFTKDWLMDGLRGRVGHMLLVGLLMVVAVCVNPSGPRMYSYPFDTVSIQTLQDYIDEWQSPDFHNLNVQPFLWLLMLTAGVFGFSKRKLDFTDFVLFSVFTYISFKAGRNIALFALVDSVILTRYASPLVEKLGQHLNYHGLDNGKPTRLQNSVNWLLFVTLLAAALVKAASVYPQETNWLYISDQEPIKAVEYIQENHPPGRLFNEYNWGGYLTLELPQYPVFVDGRTDLYGDDILEQWFTIARAEEGWQELVDQWQINLILLKPNTPLVTVLAQSGWQLLFQDDISVLYGR
jgi:hypothetical protein